MCAVFRSPVAAGTGLRRTSPGEPPRRGWSEGVERQPQEEGAAAAGMVLEAPCAPRRPATSGAENGDEDAARQHMYEALPQEASRLER